MKPIVPKGSKLNHWKTLIDTLEKNPQIAAVTEIKMDPIFPPREAQGKKFIHAAKVSVVIGTPIFKDDPATVYSAQICLEHVDDCNWIFVGCPNIHI